MAPAERVAETAWRQLWLDSSARFCVILPHTDATLAQVVPGQEAPQMPLPPLVLPLSRKRRADGGLKAERVDQRAFTPDAQGRYVERVLNIMLNAGSECHFAKEWGETKDGESTSAWKKAFAETLASRFEIGSIRNAWRTWQRWLSFLQANGLSLAGASSPQP